MKLRRAKPPIPRRENFWQRMTARQRWNEDRLFREWDEFMAQMRQDPEEKTDNATNTRDATG